MICTSSTGLAKVFHTACKDLFRFAQDVHKFCQDLHEICFLFVQDLQGMCRTKTHKLRGGKPKYWGLHMTCRGIGVHKHKHTLTGRKPSNRGLHRIRIGFAQDLHKYQRSLAGQSFQMLPNMLRKSSAPGGIGKNSLTRPLRVPYAQLRAECSQDCTGFAQDSLRIFEDLHRICKQIHSI